MRQEEMHEQQVEMEKQMMKKKDEQEWRMSQREEHIVEQKSLLVAEMDEVLQKDKHDLMKHYIPANKRFICG